MSEYPYWRIDAFVGGGLRGNPAAIIECKRWPDDKVMQATACESGGSATAFLVADESGAADWQIRWFGPGGEISLCGHATMAASHVLLGRSEAESMTFRTRKAGLLEARRTDDSVEVALPVITAEHGEWPELAKCIGTEPFETYRSDDGYAVLFFESEDDIRDLSPDLAAIAQLGNVQVTCTAPGRSSDIVSRVFTRAGGEDSVTGSAHAVLAPLWSERLGRGEFSAVQASPRGGRLDVRLDEGRVWLAGECATLIEGTYYLTG